MIHRFQCQCGTLKGEITQPDKGVRAVCYCRDCQTYAELLGHPQRVLDPLGGTDVVATQARYIRLTSGTEALACLSLSPKGLLRWYAQCCSTPIANTPRNWKLPYVGLVHTCLGRPDPIERSFPKVQMHVNTKNAKAPPPRVPTLSGIAGFAGLLMRLTKERVAGGYKVTPFFDPEGLPAARIVVAPQGAVDEARAATRR
jgi:hypothetical protein